MTHIGIDIRKIDDFGIGTYINTLLHAAGLMDPSLQFTALHKPGSDISTLPNRFHPEPEPALLYSLLEPFQLGRSAARLKLDLLHCPHYVTPLMTRVPFVVTIHDLIHLRFQQGLSWAKRLYARYFLRRAVKASRVVFTVSEFSKADLIREFGVAPERILVSHNVIHPGEFDEQRAADAALETELPERFVLYTGNNKPHKDLPTALRAFSSFRKRCGKQWQMCFAGGTFSDSAEGARLLRLVEELQIADAVHFLGYLERKQLLAVLKQASIFVFPSRYEGFGLPPLEAMAAGVPVVASNAASLPEVLGEAALYAEAGDDVMFASQMAKIAESHETAAHLTELGKENVKRFTIETFAPVLQRGYELALS